MKSDLALSSPLMNAAGTLGFTPDFHGPVDLSGFGAFVTNPISRTPRNPARGTRYIPYQGGFLLHSGLPNPGLSKALQRYQRRWAQSRLPVIVHLLANDPDELAWMVERLETVEGIMGVEVGLPPDVDFSLASQMVMAAFGELPVIIRVNMDTSMDVVQSVVEAGASAISLGAPRGSLLHNDDKVSGRLYGPAIFPLALKTVENIAMLGIPVIGAGGVYSQAEIDAMLAVGAVAVQLDTVLWRGEVPMGASKKQ